MQRLADTFVFSPSDLNHFLECEYLLRLDMEVAAGSALAKKRRPEADLLAAKGEAHEHFHLEQFLEQGRLVTEIADPGPAIDWTTAAQATRLAMTAGAGVIYQAVLVSDGWRGRADFLVRVNVPSELGPWSYEAWDTKLARHPKPLHLLQLAYYSEQLAVIQRLDPEWMYVVLGTGEHSRFRFRDFSAYFRAVRNRFLRAVQAHADVSPPPPSVPRRSVLRHGGLPVLRDGGWSRISLWRRDR
jgi:predicted RecB family nuclease